MALRFLPSSEPIERITHIKMHAEPIELGFQHFAGLLKGFQHLIELGSEVPRHLFRRVHLIDEPFL